MHDACALPYPNCAYFDKLFRTNFVPFFEHLSYPLYFGIPDKKFSRNFHFLFIFTE
jgi:hypothetical protein